MNNGKIILGSAAAITTIISSFAFRAAHKFTAHKCHVQLNNALNAHTKCVTCVTKWFAANGVLTTKCKTANGAFVKGGGVNFHTFYTLLKAGSVKTCTHPVTKITINI